MKVIRGFPIVNTVHGIVTVPMGSKIISARVVGDEINLFAEVDTDEMNLENRSISVYMYHDPMAIMKTEIFIDTVEFNGDIVHIYSDSQ